MKNIILIILISIMLSGCAQDKITMGCQVKVDIILQDAPGHLPDDHQGYLVLQDDVLPIIEIIDVHGEQLARVWYGISQGYLPLEACKILEVKEK